LGGDGILVKRSYWRFIGHIHHAVKTSFLVKDIFFI